VVVDEQGNEDESKPLLWSERTSLLTKCLTEPTLLEMYENKTYQELGGRYGAILKSVCSYAIGMDERFLPVLPGLLRRS